MTDLAGRLPSDAPSRIVVTASGHGPNPEQIARRLPIDVPDDVSIRGSREDTRQARDVESRGSAQARAREAPQGRSSATGRHMRGPGRQAWAHATQEVVISERSAGGADCAGPDRWEGDQVRDPGASPSRRGYGATPPSGRLTGSSNTESATAPRTYRYP